MSTRAWVFLLTIIGSIIGGYIPVILGASAFSIWGVLISGIGAVVGLFIGLKLGN